MFIPRQLERPIKEKDMRHEGRTPRAFVLHNFAQPDATKTRQHTIFALPSQEIRKTLEKCREKINTLKKKEPTPTLYTHTLLACCPGLMYSLRSLERTFVPHSRMLQQEKKCNM
jgi:hypothetical protein